MTRSLVVLLGMGSLGVAACSLLIDPSAESSGEGARDSGTGRSSDDRVSADEGGRAIELGDSGSDACAPTNTLVQNETFGPPNPAWLILGTTSVDKPMPGWAELTTQTASQAGALMWGTPVDLTEFDVTATFAIEKPDATYMGDGLAFVWGKKLGPGGTGGAKGFQGAIDGYAVQIDTYISPTEDPPDAVAPYISLVPDRSPYLYLARANLPKAVINAQSHTLHVALRAGKVNAQVDGVAVLTDETIPSYTGFTGYWGFTAATGFYTSVHRVQKITMKAGKPTCN